MFDDKRSWSALLPISNHSNIRQLQFATHAFSQKVLQQAVQIGICQWSVSVVIENLSYMFTSTLAENTSSKFQSFIVCTIYRPPNTTTNCFDNDLLEMRIFRHYLLVKYVHPG